MIVEIKIVFDTEKPKDEELVTKLVELVEELNDKLS